MKLAMRSDRLQLEQDDIGGQRPHVRAVTSAKWQEAMDVRIRSSDRVFCPILVVSAC